MNSSRSFAVLVLALGLISVGSSRAQVNGVAASVTSQNFGGHANRSSGIPPSITSLGSIAPHHGFRTRPAEPMRERNHRERGRGGFTYFGAPYYYDYSYLPYVDDLGANDVVSDDYNPGPTTVFERRDRPYPGEYADREARDSGDRPNNSQPSNSDNRSAPAPEPAQPQPQTVLVFKDGHQTEIQNYAIVGATLYELGDGKRHKIDLAELDLRATAKENDDRGIDFAIPPGIYTN